MGSRSRWVAFGAVLALTAASAVIAGDVRDRWLYDEAWMLQVLDRVRGGEVLYRDVFLGVTPLSVYLMAPLVWLGGAEAWLLRAFHAACVLAMAWMAARLARQSGLSAASAAAVALGTAAWMRPWPASHYGSLAQMFLMASACAAASTRFGWAGVWAGLAFASKQNTGVLALLAVVAIARRRSAPAVMAFAVTVASILTPVISSGGGPGLLDFGFLGKGAYAKHGVSLPPSDGVARLTQAAQDDGVLWTGLRAMRFVPFGLALPPAALLLWARRRRDGMVLLLAVFGLAAAVSTAPRFDLDHVRLTVPLGLCAFAWMLTQWKMRSVWVAAPAAVFALFDYGVPVAAMIHGKTQPVAQSHYRYVYASTDQIERVVKQSRELAGRDAYLQSPRASVLYLLSGTRNPTPFDYPLISAFGRSGQQRVIDEFRSGRIGCAWVDDAADSEMQPLELVSYVKGLEHVEAKAGGVLYCRGQLTNAFDRSRR